MIKTIMEFLFGLLILGPLICFLFSILIAVWEKLTEED